MGIDCGLVGGSADTLSATSTLGFLATVVVKLVGGHALHGLAEAGMNLAGGLATEGLGGRDLVARSLGRSVVDVAGVCGVGGGAASRESLGVEFGNGVVAGEDTRLVLLSC